MNSRARWSWVMLREDMIGTGDYRRPVEFEITDQIIPEGKFPRRADPPQLCQLFLRPHFFSPTTSDRIRPKAIYHRHVNKNLPIEQRGTCDMYVGLSIFSEDML